MARQLRAGAYRPLDKSRLPNLKNLDPQLLALAATADPGNAHGVPYLWSVTGIGFNLPLVERALGDTAPRDSLALPDRQFGSFQAGRSFCVPFRQGEGRHCWQ